jgi:hypothetical protein
MKIVVILQYNYRYPNELYMKKVLLSVYLFSVVAFYGYSQSLTLSNQHGAIQPNAIIVQAGTPDSVELITYLNVKNISNATIKVFCKKVQLTMLDSTEMTMCWAGNCYPAPVNVSPFSQSINAGQTNTEFIGHYTQTAFSHFKSGESVIRWVFYNQANVNDSASVTVKYTTYPLGIDESNGRQAVLSNAYPNPANAVAGFNYAVPSGSQARIVIRNILGSIVHSEQVSTGSGKISVNTANLTDGIYFYSLMLDGKNSQTKKLVVKH